MAAKPPIDDARWAETAGGSPSANMSEPSSGKKDVGWDDAEIPPAEWFNWLANAIFQWAKYLSDGALTGNHTIAGTLVLDNGGGTATLTCDGVGTVGNSQIGGILTVVGDIIAQDDVTITDQLSVGGNIEATGDVGFNAAHTMPVPVAAFEGAWVYSPITVGGFTGPHAAPTLVADAAQAPLHLDVGDRITALSWIVDAQNIDQLLLLVYYDASTGARTVVNTISTGATTGRQTYLDAAVNHTLVVNRLYQLEVVCNGTPAAGALFGVEVTYHRPL